MPSTMRELQSSCDKFNAKGNLKITQVFTIPPCASFPKHEIKPTYGWTSSVAERPDYSATVRHLIPCARFTDSLPTW